MAVERILKWLGDNKLTVNLSKTQYSIFQTKNMSVPNYLNSIKINSEVISRVQSVKFLGIILDEKLKWDEHIKQLLETLTKITNTFKTRMWNMISSPATPTVCQIFKVASWHSYNYFLHFSFCFVLIIPRLTKLWPIKCQGHPLSLWCWPLTCNLEKCYSLRSCFGMYNLER